jgi:hypothetical protein
LRTALRGTLRQRRRQRLALFGGGQQLDWKRSLRLAGQCTGKGRFGWRGSALGVGQGVRAAR